MPEWFNKFFVKELTPEEQQDRYDTSPNLFSDQQRQYLKGLFPKAMTHLDNFSQEELLKVANALTVFGYTIDSEARFIRSLSMLAYQGLIETASHNPYLIRRA